MRPINLIAIVILAIFQSQSLVWAQTALERLEQKLLIPPTEARPAAKAQEPGYLGIVTDDRQEQGRGVRVVEVLVGGPASKAGIQAGDLLRRVEDRPLKTNADLGAAIERTVVGTVLKFDLLRGEDERSVHVTFGKRPPAEERRFEAFGRQPNAGELPPPPPPNVVGPVDSQLPELPVGRADTKRDQSRIDLLERRVAELERRLAELEQLLRKP